MAGAAACAQRLDRRILPGELSRQGVDLWLALGRDGGEVRAVTLEERARIAGPTAAGCGTLATELRDQRRHAPDDLPVDHVELALRLAAYLPPARELRDALRGRLHRDLPCQPMKLDGPE
jgi:hypothetical protein